MSILGVSINQHIPAHLVGAIVGTIPGHCLRECGNWRFIPPHNYLSQTRPRSVECLPWNILDVRCGFHQ